MQAAEFLVHLIQRYTAHANNERASGMKRYMRDQFPFFGIASPLRKDLSRQVIREFGLPENAALMELCQDCFAQEHRELQYFVQDALRPLAAKRLSPDWLPVLEQLILTRSWWDTVDFLAPKLAGPILLRFPDQALDWHERWIASDNFWLQRSAILLQLDYKAKTDPDLLFSHVLWRKDSQEFFVQKAAGWALRQYARTNPHAVRGFLEAHPDLPRLTLREAAKHLSP